MDRALETIREARLHQAGRALERNGFEVSVVSGAGAARALVVEQIIPGLMRDEGCRTASFGGSMTLVNTGIHEGVLGIEGLGVLDTYDTSRPRFEVLRMRREALLADIFLMSANAVTETGKLVNLDGSGNRVAAMAFGPRFVIVVAGRNKLVASVADGMRRVRELAAPANAMRLERKVPCVKTMRCEDCSSPERICNVWGITEKSWPKGRVKVVLVDQDLGF